MSKQYVCICFSYWELFDTLELVFKSFWGSKTRGIEINKESDGDDDDDDDDGFLPTWKT